MLVLTASLIVSGYKIVRKTQAGKLASKIIVFCLSPVSDLHVHLLSFIFPNKVALSTHYAQHGTETSNFLFCFKSFCTRFNLVHYLFLFDSCPNRGDMPT